MALVAVLLTAVVMTLWRPAPASSSTTPAVSRLNIALPEGDEVSFTNMAPLAIAPDGSAIVYVAARDRKVQLYVRKLADREPTALAGTEGGRQPFFSPDGRWLGFFADRKLKKVTISGTGVQPLADATDARGGTWAEDDTIYFAPTNTSGILKVPASGGPAVEMAHPDRAQGEISYRWPHALPGNHALLFDVWTGPGADERQLTRISLPGGERHVLMASGDEPRYVSPGYLLYGRLDGLFAVPWRPEQPGLNGAAPVALSELPRLEGEGASDFVVSNGGTLAYLAGGPARRAHRVVWVDRAGKAVALSLPERDYESVAISPDGRQAVVQVYEGAVGLWLYDFARQTLTPFVTTGGSSQAPVWTADGKRVVYRGTRTGLRNLYAKAADGTGAEVRLTTKADVIQTPTSVSPDGQ